MKNTAQLRNFLMERILFFKCGAVALKLSVAMALMAIATARKLTEKTLRWRKDLKKSGAHGTSQ